MHMAYGVGDHRYGSWGQMVEDRVAPVVVSPDVDGGSFWCADRRSSLHEMASEAVGKHVSMPTVERDRIGDDGLEPRALHARVASGLQNSPLPD